MVASNKLYTPQEYLEEVTGEYYILQGDDDMLGIKEVLTLNGDYNKRTYKLEEVDKLTDGDFVLVEIGYYDQIEDNWYKDLVWCEI